MAYGTLAHYLQQVSACIVLRDCRQFRAAEERSVCVRGVRVHAAIVLQVKRSLQQCDGDVLAVSVACRPMQLLRMP